MTSNTDTRRLAFSYLRFSSPEQMKGDSYRRQLKATSDFVASRGWQLADTSYFDQGKSAFRGANARDGKLGEFLAAIESGAVPKGSVLVIEALDRLSRDDPLEFLPVLRRIIKAGVSIATTMNGRVYGEADLGGGSGYELIEIIVLLMQGHEESLKKSERHKANWQNKRSLAEGPQRQPMSARAPAWLTLSDDRQTFVIVEHRAAIVRRIFEEYLGGAGANRIAAMLNEERIEPFGRARLWHRSYVLKIIGNRAVIGECTPNVMDHEEDGQRRTRPLTPIPDYFPQIVDPDAFSRAAAMRTSRRAPSTRKGNRPISHVLAGLARCPKCGSAMGRVSKGSGPKAGHPKLVCYRARSKAGCVVRGVRVDMVEDAVMGGIEELAMKGDPGTSAQWLDSVKQQQEAKARIEERLQRLLTAITEGDEAEGETRRRLDVSMPTAGREVRKLERQLQEIEEWLQEVNTKLTTFGPSSVKARLNELAAEASLKEPDIVRINAILRQLMSRVVVNFELGEITFHWHGTGVTRLPCDRIAQK